MTTKKKTFIRPAASTLPAEFEERIDIDRGDIYPKEMIDRHVARYRWAVGQVTRRYGRAGWTLDAACGTGYGSLMLMSASHKVLGLDLNADVLQEARARFGGSLLTFRQSDFRKQLPISSDQFDAAVCIETIEHFDESHGANFLRELYRSVVPGGILILSTPSFDKERGMTSTYHVKEYTPNEMVAIVTAAGFVDIELDGPDNLWVKDMPGFIFLRARKPEVVR